MFKPKSAHKCSLVNYSDYPKCGDNFVSFEAYSYKRILRKCVEKQMNLQEYNLVEILSLKLRCKMF